ncbi:GumC family protein [Bacteroidota bacterium]
MDNGTQNDHYTSTDTNTIKDYIRLIRNNWLSVILITLSGLAVAIVYAVNAVDIYKSTTILSLSKTGGDVLTSPLMPEFNDWGNDRFIANEIEVLKSYTTREKVASALIDSFHLNPNTFNYNVLLNSDVDLFDTPNSPRSIRSLTSLLEDISVDQKRGLDIVEITAESPSSTEAALIANTYAHLYMTINLDMNRKALRLVTNFLEEQKSEKYEELNDAEETMKIFQEKGGLIALDKRATTLIELLAEFESKKGVTQVELMASNKVLENLQKELERQNPRMADYLKSLSSQTYITAIQNEIVKMEINREVALLNNEGNQKNSAAIEEYDRNISNLQAERDKQLEVFKAGIFASSPDEVKGLTQKIIEQEVKNQALQTSIKELDKIVKSYETRFLKLPKSTLELARLRRRSEALEKLYLLLEQRYQEALINVESQPGNVIIIDKARIPKRPSKPNRTMIVLVGLVLGSGLAFGYIFIRNYFDDTIKTPEDIQNKNINVLAWIPKIEGLGVNGKRDFQFIVAKSPDSIPSEAFRALRTRVQYSRIAKDTLKTILVTSATPREGKTTISVNLAGSFALTNKKTLLMDCDLRKPTVHHVFKTQRVPGLIDYLFGDAKLDEIVKQTDIDNLSYIPTGTIPPNPAELLDSNEMKDLLAKFRAEYDLVIIDSPPIIAVTDSEILSNMVDGTIIVVSADTTEIELMERAVELIKAENTHFLGTVLNNFSFKSGYGSYYKYYYYYSTPEAKRSKV